MVEPLADDLDVVEVALAAVKLAHDATGTVLDVEEIPEEPASTTGPVRAAPPARPGGASRAGRP